MEISKLIQIVSRSMGKAIGITCAIYYTFKALASAVGNNVVVAMIGMTILLTVMTIIKEKNKCRI